MKFVIVYFAVLMWQPLEDTCVPAAATAASAAFLFARNSFYIDSCRVRQQLIQQPQMAASSISEEAFGLQSTKARSLADSGLAGRNIR